MTKHKVFVFDTLKDREPVYALVANVDLVIIRYGDEVSVLYGRCAHRGALMADGYIDGHNIICGVHGWDHRFDSGVSEYNNAEILHKFTAWVEDGDVYIDEDEIRGWENDHPQPFDRAAYQGLYQDSTGTTDEPHVHIISQLAAEGLSKLGHHGPMAAMGVSRNELPKWDDIQLNVAQVHRMPLLDDVDVAIDCLGMRACNSNNCPVGIATQKESLRARLIVDQAAQRLQRFFSASVELMQVMARACGHDHLNQFVVDDLTTFKKDMAELSGVRFGGVNA